MFDYRQIESGLLECKSKSSSSAPKTEKDYRKQTLLLDVSNVQDHASLILTSLGQHVKVILHVEENREDRYYSMATTADHSRGFFLGRGPYSSPKITI